MHLPERVVRRSYLCRTNSCRVSIRVPRGGSAAPKCAHRAVPQTPPTHRFMRLPRPLAPRSDIGMALNSQTLVALSRESLNAAGRCVRLGSNPAPQQSSPEEASNLSVVNLAACCHASPTPRPRAAHGIVPLAVRSWRTRRQRFQAASGPPTASLSSMPTSCGPWRAGTSERSPSIISLSAASADSSCCRRFGSCTRLTS